MKKIKTLLIGESPFSGKNYRNLKYSELNIKCKFKEVAFIPKSDTNYNVLSITTYRRILGLLNKCKINEKNRQNFHNDINKLIKQLANDNIYLVNCSELKTLDFKNNYRNYISVDTNIICFGKVAYEYIESIGLSNKIYHCPHPSGHVHHNFWDKYNKDKNSYAKSSSIEKLY
ncbi:hypothetical protein MXL97_10305 [Mammaliicoccus fleurettii]|uniref:hypothetical protein n=1 Tax=Mammaliicoccus fleurettii TaxID=150056 RepID=UPI002DB79ADD|nr:hypothetical protein [Mammaliicoccus fleurettii]MEB6202191.1 hypothetical protein [Mammaliicoccus fleurettii]